MATVILYFLALLTTSSSDAEGLRLSAPSYLNHQSAWENLVAARTAGAMHGVDSDLILSVAWHESRFQHEVKTPLSSSRTTTLHSCGVMTPYPTDDATCASQASSLLAGYLAGAEHVSVWRRAVGADRMLGGVAGGYRFLQRCEGSSAPPCDTPQIFRRRAELIKRLRAHARRGVS